jgi:hypothetical protein
MTADIDRLEGLMAEAERLAEKVRLRTLVYLAARRQTDGVQQAKATLEKYTPKPDHQTRSPEMATVDASVCLQLIAEETTELVKALIESQATYFEKLLNAETPEELIKARSEFAKAHYSRLAERGTRIRDLYSNFS